MSKFFVTIEYSEKATSDLIAKNWNRSGISADQTKSKMSEDWQRTTDDSRMSSKYMRVSNSGK